ncbi:MAG: hypothetical protein WCK95_14975 [Alphaproteobacteria bacterium]
MTAIIFQIAANFGQFLCQEVVSLEAAGQEATRGRLEKNVDGWLARYSLGKNGPEIPAPPKE